MLAMQFKVATFFTGIVYNASDFMRAWAFSSRSMSRCCLFEVPWVKGRNSTGGGVEGDHVESILRRSF